MCSATAPDAALLLPAGFNGAEVTGHTLHDVFCDDPKRQSLNRRTSHNIYAYDLSPLQHGKVRGHLASTSQSLAVTPSDSSQIGLESTSFRHRTPIQTLLCSVRTPHPMPQLPAPWANELQRLTFSDPTNSGGLYPAAVRQDGRAAAVAGAQELSVAGAAPCQAKQV